MKFIHKQKTKVISGFFKGQTVEIREISTIRRPFKKDRYRYLCLLTNSDYGFQYFNEEELEENKCQEKK